MQAEQPHSPAPQQHQQAMGNMTSSTSVPDPERYRPSSSPPPQAQADQSSLPSPTTSKQGAGQLVRRLSGNALRDNKPPSIPQTPSGSGVEYVLNTLAAQATRSAPPHIRNFRVHHDPQGNAYTRSPEGTAMPLNSNHQLQLATSPTRSGGVHKPFKSPLVSPQASTETIIEQHPDTSAEEREREKQKAETAAKKEDEERQIREALALAEALQVEEKEEKVQEQQPQQQQARASGEQMGDDRIYQHPRPHQHPQPRAARSTQPQQLSNVPPQQQRSMPVPPMRSSVPPARLMPPQLYGRPPQAPHRQQQQQQQQMVTRPRDHGPGRYARPVQQGQPYHPPAQGHAQQDMRIVPRPSQQQPPQRPQAQSREGRQANTVPARYDPYGPEDDVFIDHDAYYSGVEMARRSKRHREEEEEEQHEGQNRYGDGGEPGEQDRRDAKRPRSREATPPNNAQEGYENEQDEGGEQERGDMTHASYPSHPQEEVASEAEHEKDAEAEAEDDEEEVPFDPTAPIEPYDYVKNIQEPWNEMMDEMLPYLDEWAEKYLTTSLDVITSTYVSFFNKAKQDAELLEEGFDEIKWHQAWQNSRRQTFIDFRKQMEMVAKALVDLDPEDGGPLPTPPSAKPRIRRRL